MKKKIAWIMAFVMILFVPVQLSAADLPVEYRESRIVYEQDGIIVEEELIVYGTSSQMMRASGTKSASKNYNIKDANGGILATYTLKGTFSYNGSSATCTKASYDTSVSNIFWSFSSASAQKSGSSAKGSFTAKCIFPSQTISKSITLTCSASGTIS